MLVGMAADIVHLPPDFDINELGLLDPHRRDQWSTKWDRPYALFMGWAGWGAF